MYTHTKKKKKNQKKNDNKNDNKYFKCKKKNQKFRTI